ncbi:MAG: hypothetical protein ABIH78_04075, partial [Candidatus Peregrinibacteria bacterium]
SGAVGNAWAGNALIVLAIFAGGAGAAATAAAVVPALFAGAVGDAVALTSLAGLARAACDTVDDLVASVVLRSALCGYVSAGAWRAGFLHARVIHARLLGCARLLYELPLPAAVLPPNVAVVAEVSELRNGLTQTIHALRGATRAGAAGSVATVVAAGLVGAVWNTMLRIRQNVDCMGSHRASVAGLCESCTRDYMVSGT